MRNLIVNADDLGWTAGVNRGIAEAHRHGIVTSTSLLANGAAFADGVRTAGELPGLTTKSLDVKEVEKEWAAQIEKVRAAGIRPTHLDGHKHVHMLPGLFGVALRLAKRHGIEAIRVSLEESSLRTALASGSQHRAGVVMKQ